MTNRRQPYGMMQYLSSHSKQARRALSAEVAAAEAARRTAGAAPLPFVDGPPLPQNRAALGFEGPMRQFEGPLPRNARQPARATAAFAPGAVTATKAAAGSAAKKGLGSKLIRRLKGGGAAGFVGFMGADLLADYLFGGTTKQVVDDTGTYVTGGVRQQIEQAVRNRAMQNLIAAKAERLRGDISANINSLRQNAPDVYQQLIAGRRLPEGAVVFGGGARMDLLERVAMQMAEGQYGMPPSSRVRLEGSLEAMQNLQQDQIRATISSTPPRR